MKWRDAAYTTAIGRSSGRISGGRISSTFLDESTGRACSRPARPQ